MLRIMTNNIWWCDSNQPAWEKNGEDCSAKARAGGFVRVYSELSPDVIGLQEASAKMVAELVGNMQSWNERYSVLWGGDTPIMYKPQRLELIDSDFAYYDEHIDGFEGKFNNDKTKSYTIAVFREKDSGKIFVFATTHLWWKSSNPKSSSFQPYSDEARAYQLRYLISKVEYFVNKYSCPSVIVGDLNANYDSLALKEAFDSGYSHAHDIATEYANDKNGYHYCFADGYRGYEPLEFKRGIDHILIKGEQNGAIKRFDRYSPDYYMPLSDHFPAYIDVDF